MMMAKNDQAPKWSKDMRQLIVSKLAAWTPYKEIWEYVTSDKLRDEVGLEPLDPDVYNYNLFRMRCKRVPKKVVAEVHEEWKKRHEGIRWAEEKNRVLGLSDLIDRVNGVLDEGDFNKDTTGTLAALVGQLKSLYEQVRKELAADADREALSKSGARILLQNPRNVEIDAGYVSELMLVYREEIGGLHNLDFSALNMQELRLLAEAVSLAMQKKLDAIEEAEAIDDEEDDSE
jgi:hypothetical protein